MLEKAVFAGAVGRFEEAVIELVALTGDHREEVGQRDGGVVRRGA